LFDKAAIVRVNPRRNVMKTRTATVTDFTPGAKLIDKGEGWHHILRDEYAPGIWNTHRGVVAFENEAINYLVEIKGVES
jgi:hypothetical protein